ncbi:MULTISPECIES: hemolysin III family protein [Bacillaceae]|uniref:Hemolysin D n=1 Tax=Gottfriedia luciferensis TaxID=178774 RepID=A0ABX2ZVK7_9BACI|nr:MULTISPECIES: hemolysin III family protein [Bacillaceae]ODG93818.1 hemolysin D [Gottfriedia luciferensis]PGZ87359.1 hemolysin D [Bacillus sp. AFS029533]SFC28764.1 hemolysin III [Bacillus sp. UNCCL81]
MSRAMKEELANAITHGIGAILSIPALYYLISKALHKGTPWHLISFTVFGLSMLLLYICSTLLHSVRDPKLIRLFTILDHSAIYLLIAGTYTPFLLITLRGKIGWSLFTIIWGLAVSGVIFKFIYVNKFELFSTIVYLIMGWLMMFAIKPIYVGLSGIGFFYLLLGGLFYSIGTIFFLVKRWPYSHAIWHLFVLLGSASMYFCIFKFVV